MLLFVLSVIIQATFIVHILKTGRATIWIWLVLMVPVAGSLAYFIVEILPELRGTKTGRKAARKFETMVNPDKELNQARAAYEMSHSIENAIRLAQALMIKEQFAEANALYRESLKGIHAHDPHIMFGLARSEFALKKYAETKKILDELIKQNPDYKNVDAHLLYARALELSNNVEAALHEYEALDEYYPGPEASYHYAKLLQTKGDIEKSQRLLKKIIAKAKISGNYYNDIHRTWIKLAKAEYQGNE